MSSDRSRLEIEGTAAHLGTTYWANGRPESIVHRSIEGSIAFGVYDGEQQVGFARVVTDRATFASTRHCAGWRFRAAVMGPAGDLGSRSTADGWLPGMRAKDVR